MEGNSTHKPFLPLFARLVLCICWASTAIIGDAQQSQSKPGSIVAVGADDIPVFKLEFKDKQPVQGVQGSDIIAYPMACSPDGVPFADEIVSPKTMERSIVSLEPKGGHVFSLKSALDLKDLRLVGFFPSDSSVAFLVTATSDSKTSTFEARAPNEELKTVQGYFGEHHYYVILFDRDGNYQSKVELPGSFSNRRSASTDYKKVAIFPSGELLLLEYESANRIASLKISDAAGQSLRSIEIPIQMMQDPVLAHGVDGTLEEKRASRSLSTWQFAASGKNIVMYQPNVNAPLLELGAGGLVREVPVSSPAGYTLDALIAGSGRWIARFRKEGVSFDKAVDSSAGSNNFQLFELNPLDGSLKLRLDDGGTDFSYGIACEAGGVLTAINLGDNSKFVELRADLPR